MPMQPSKYIWQDGRMVRWEDATVHVLTHALHYGSSVFEGIRVYPGPNGPVGLRLTDHVSRMYDSAKIYYLEIPYEPAELVAACKDVVIRNGLHNGAYVRPLAFRGYGEMGGRRRSGCAGTVHCRRMGMGVRTLARRELTAASTSVFLPGSAQAQIRFPPWPRPGATTSQASS